ncbi:MAG: hemoglobin [Bacteriovoracaceae bacterium]|jgi:hemoglobin
MNLYDKYGGFEAYHKIIYKLYLDLFDHPEVAYHFIGVNIETLSKHQAQFLCRALGGNVKYEGRSMKDVHLGMNISEFQFKEVAQSFSEIFLRSGFEENDVAFIMRFIGRYEKVIVSCKFSMIDRIMIPIYHIFDRVKYFMNIK